MLTPRMQFQQQQQQILSPPPKPVRTRRQQIRRQKTFITLGTLAFLMAIVGGIILYFAVFAKGGEESTEDKEKKE